ncbi:PREDICTED: AT-rich interactive domain-containing protein 3C isoform X1 [Acromyrmex echinatior]|uniref:AT-rich interactive domain-containing protein 3C isoform X1 n=1 Tax=Acromyrmex echinatior TaxID=103372 RepID=UPI000580D424|nr:PREDICTED: AT-rich interactive domain-containing protein 3C isoform X1 [Acromyrmex echinatior]
MDTADDQEIENPGGGSLINGANGTNGTNGANGQHQTPEGSLYQEGRSEDESEIDDETQDEEDLLSSSLQVNPQVSLDAAVGVSSLVQLNNLMTTHNPQILAKLRLEQAEADMLQGRNSLEVLQAAMNSSSFGNLFPPLYLSSPPPPPPLPPSLSSQPSQNNHSQIAGSLGNQIGENQALACSTTSSRPVATSQSNESSPPRCRNNGESQGNSRNNGEAREGETRAASVNSQHPPGTNWSFEEQFRQLYELDDTPERKVFLDDLFTFMQSRGTPISRLPIMAKSVLDLYELYKLVVLRGGLVEVINKKLWQEIIKGLRLPASITSAAFTLRTQYMKYLYPYEKEKEGLSTQEQLQTAIETNRRESRRNNYTTYADNQVPRNQHNSLPPNPMPLPLSIAQMAVAANESQHHVVNGHPHGSQHHPQHLPPNLANLPSNQLSDYMLRILRDRNTMSNNPMIQGNTSTPPPAAMAEGFKSGMHLWNMYSPGNNNMYPAAQPFSPSSSHSPLAPANSPEQREALDLANSGNSRSVSSPAFGGEMKRNQEAGELSSPTSSKRMFLSDVEGNNIGHNMMHSLRIRQRISTRDPTKRELEISVQLDNTLYEGVLGVTQEGNSNNGSTSSSPDNGKRTQNNDS